MSALGERERGTARLEEAVDAFREALQERTCERIPLEWAKSAGSQRITLMLLAERRRDAEMAKLAVQQIEAAFTASCNGGDTHSSALFEEDLQKARVIRDRLAASESKPSS